MRGMNSLTMPELPDVENFKRYLDAKALRQDIRHVTVRGAGKLLRNVSARKLSRALSHHRLAGSRRHGKHLMVRFDGRKWLAVHFGMTGYFAYFKNDADDPKHDRMRLDFANGRHLAYVSQRKLGALRLIDDPEEFIEDEHLGPDALAVGLKEFHALMAERSGQIKAALMDQGLIAGIGNVYSDEILFQARIHPRAPVDNLTEKQISNLHRVMRRVLRMAIRKGAGTDDLFRRLPRGYLLRNRQKGAECPRCGGKIRTMKAAGRTAYVCPKCQKMPG